MKFLRRMVYNRRRNKICNDKMRETLNVEKLTDMEKNILKWFGHLKRMVKGRLPQRMLHLKVQGQQPRERWIDQVKKNLQGR